MSFVTIHIEKAVFEVVDPRDVYYLEAEVDARARAASRKTGARTRIPHRIALPNRERAGASRRIRSRSSY